jgi:autotransporter-associated beta strand protein
MTNWSGDAAPYAGIALQFGGLSGGSATNRNDFTAGTSFNGIAFTSAAPTYNLQGNAISLAGPIQNSSSNRQTVGLDITLVAGGGTLDSGTAGLNVSGAISGAKPLTKIGAGALILSGSNTYSGGTTISSGTLQVGNSSALGAGGLSIGPATMDVAGNFADGRNISLTDPDATIQVDPSFAYSNSGTLSGTGGLSLTGSGTLILSGSDNYTGGTIVTGGRLVAESASALPSDTSLTIGAGGTLIFDPSMAGASATASTTAAVPEPGTLAMLTVVVFGAFVSKRVFQTGGGSLIKRARVAIDAKRLHGTIMRVSKHTPMPLLG